MVCELHDEDLRGSSDEGVLILVLMEYGLRVLALQTTAEQIEAS